MLINTQINYYSCPYSNIMTRKLWLFDIDGTLVTTAGVGKRALEITFEKRFGPGDYMTGITLAGNTDVRILKGMMKNAGLRVESYEEVIDEILPLYFKTLRSLLHHEPRVAPMPGMKELLTVLGSDESIRVGLLTGNYEIGGRLKIKRCGLNHFFPFGVFADDGEERNTYVSISRRKYHAIYGEAIDASDIFVIGDTPRDIACAHAGSAVSVAVATSRYDRNALAEYSPALLFNDFSDYQKVYTAIKNYTY